MSGRIVKLDTSTHQAVQELLPWFVTDTLDSEEQALVREHLQICTQCQVDADWQRALQALHPRPNPLPDVEHALAQLRPRLATPQSRTKRGVLAAFLQDLLGEQAAWMRWALAGQTAIIAGLALLLVPPPHGGNASYRALGMPGNTAGNVVVMFRPETTEQELRRILQESDARVVDGPTVADAYVLNVPSARQARIIRTLRSKHAVVMVEPLDSGGSH